MLRSPIELVKIRTQLDNSKYRSAFECFKDLALNHGFRSFTRGIFLTVCKEMPACAVYLTSYELMTGEKKGNKAPLSQLLMAGGAAGCLCWLTIYPIDTIKTKFQQNDSYKSILKCTVDCFKAEGYRGFYRGLNAALLRF